MYTYFFGKSIQNFITFSQLYIMCMFENVWYIKYLTSLKYGCLKIIEKGLFVILSRFMGQSFGYWHFSAILNSKYTRDPASSIILHWNQIIINCDEIPSTCFEFMSDNINWAKINLLFFYKLSLFFEGQNRPVKIRIIETQYIINLNLNHIYFESCSGQYIKLFFTSGQIFSSLMPLNKWSFSKLGKMIVEISILLHPKQYKIIR